MRISTQKIGVFITVVVLIFGMNACSNPQKDAMIDGLNNIGGYGYVGSPEGVAGGSGAAFLVPTKATANRS